MNTETKICRDEDDYCDHGNPYDGDICEKCADAAITPTERALDIAEAKVQAAIEWIKNSGHRENCQFYDWKQKCTCGKEAILDKLRHND